MKTTNLRLSLSLSVVLFFQGILSAQQYQWKAALSPVAEDGFYKILLDPKIAAKTATASRADIRLLDQEEKEFPYLIQQEVNGANQKWFKEYIVVSKQLEKNQFSRLVIHNPLKTKIDNFSLIVRNTTAYKSADLSGSDDQENWFNISDDYALNNMYDTEDVTAEKSLHFPLSNYEYYKLEISDSASAPLNIIKVGNYYSDSPHVLMQLIEPISARQIDSAKLKVSFINVSLQTNQLIHRLKFAAAAPKFFKRNASLYSIEIYKGKKTKNYICDFEVSSAVENEFTIPEVYGKDFVVEIQNNDSPPLEKVNISFLQNATSIVAYLNKGKQYHLNLSNSKATLPQYDLDEFAQNIPADVKQLNVLSIDAYKYKAATSEEATKSLLTSKLWVWAVLAVVILLLAYVTFKMITEMGKKEGDTESGG